MNITIDFNLYGGNENVMRAFEIAMAGNFRIKLINSEDVDTALSQKQFAILKTYLEDRVTENASEAEILVEVVKPSISSLTRCSKMESKTDIINRAFEAKRKANANPPEIVREASMSLLKTAYERLAFQPYVVAIILDIAKTIAILDNPQATTIDPQHIAEAIQYRSLPKELRE